LQARSSKWQEKEANKKRKPVAKGSNRRRKNKNICERKQAARQQARHGRRKQPEKQEAADLKFKDALSCSFRKQR